MRTLDNSLLLQSSQREFCKNSISQNSLMRQNNYKQDIAIFDMGFYKRGQVALFVIIAIVIVSILLIFVFFEDIKPIIPSAGTSEFSPKAYLASCVNPSIQESISFLGKNAGYKNISEGSVKYDGEDYKYLCYRAGYYQTCIVQQPFIKNNFENYLTAEVEPKIEDCIAKLKQEYEAKGYEVKTGRARARLEIIPSAIKIEYDAPMTTTKDGVSKTFTGFDVKINSEMHELLYIAQSIIDYESTFGDSETTLYMQYYPNIVIDKIRLSDGTNIYKLKNALTKEEFRFASRSMAWPAGYGISEIYKA